MEFPVAAPMPTAPDPLGLVERIARSFPELTRYVRRRMGPDLVARESASDIAQSTVRELLSGRPHEERGEGSFQRWLRGAAENKIRNRARYWRSAGRNLERARLEQPEQCLDPTPSRPSQDAELAEQRERLLEALAHLPEAEGLALRRVRLEGADLAQVALELDRTPEAVRKLVARGLARLSSRLHAGCGAGVERDEA